MKVVLSADALDKGRCSRKWCIEHLGARDTVFAVVGVPPLSGFVLGVPPIDPLDTEHEVLIQTDGEYCQPIRAAGIACEPRVVPRGQARAVVDVAIDESADLIVIGKRPRSRLGDALWDGAAHQILHQPPCPVVVVPTASRRAASTAGVTR
jgi:nucleotide-binding universal stress UspA family protein